MLALLVYEPVLVKVLLDLFSDLRSLALFMPWLSSLRMTIYFVLRSIFFRVYLRLFAYCLNLCSLIFCSSILFSVFSAFYRSLALKLVSWANKVVISSLSTRDLSLAYSASIFLIYAIRSLYSFSLILASGI